MIVMKNPSRAGIKEQHNPELESRQCCPYSCCSRHRISPGDPLSMLGSGRRRFPVSLSTSLYPRPSHPHQALLTDHTPGPSPRRACDSQVHRQTKIQLWKRKTPKGISGGPNGKGTPSSCPLPSASHTAPFSLTLLWDARPLPAALPAHSSLSFPGSVPSPDGAGVSWLQLSEELRALRAGGMIPATSRSHLAATCRELLSQTWLPHLPPISHRASSLRANAGHGRGGRDPAAAGPAIWNGQTPTWRAWKSAGTDAPGHWDVQRPVLAPRWDRLTGLSWLSPGLKARSAMSGTPGSFRHSQPHLRRVWREGMVRVFIPSPWPSLCLSCLGITEKPFP